MHFPTNLDGTWHMHFSSPGNKRWCDFISKNNPEGQMGEGDGVDAKSCIFRLILIKLGACIFIAQKQIPELFHFEKRTPGPKWVEGGTVEAKSCIFRRIWTKFGTCIFYPRNKYWHDFITKNQPQIQNRGRGEFLCKIKHFLMYLDQT